MAIEQLRHIFNTTPELAKQLTERLRMLQEDNADPQTNPVRSIEDMYAFFARLLTMMPWEALTLPEASVFRRIDQSIGYVYYLLGDLLDAFPALAEWLTEYNTAWGNFLSSEESWTDEYYRLLKSDSRFELDTERYESPDNWHSFNDFFARKLHTAPVGLSDPLCSFVSDGERMDFPVKTMSVEQLSELLGDSPYAERFVGAKAEHYVLDVYHYHHYHAPVSGRVLECRIIPGMHTAGGKVIWDKAQKRYRYEQTNNTDFQALETRGILIIEQNHQLPLVALIPVGVMQIGSVSWNPEVQVGAMLDQGQDLGCFRFGGSDVVVLRENS